MLRNPDRSPVIARRRFFRPNENIRKQTRVNDQIRKSPIRLIDENENMVGVVDTRDALQRAEAAGLDLVEVSPDSDPPVCRILDFGKYRYEQSKKERASRTKTAEQKEVRLGRSMKIDPHDIGIRLAQARKFLMDGHKVQIVQNFRGREMAHKERGYERMKDVIAELEDIARVDMPPKMAGRRITMILSPDKNKVDRIKAALEQEQKQKQKAAEAKTEEAPAEVASSPAEASSTQAPPASE
ncbi:MAG: translation initiation factor IF-3 [Phycisphaerales bacterium]|nr:translation initiation factor IF-3 [Phycisphaerales bacterium]